MNVGEIVSVLNRLSVCALKNMGSKPNTLKLWIERGAIVGFVNEDGKKEKIYKVERGTKI